MSNYAWVTLATNDSYSLGALVVANSLKNVNTIHQTAVLITPGVSESMKSKLEASFNIVVEVNVLDSQDAANLALLSRPELGVTFTKLHCWRLTQFEKCVFLDADTFVLQNCDELFDREELSAAPDVGWPDCFNSGVFVFRPSLDTFGKLIEFATRQGSFDGGDQGLLNSFFSDWAHKDISKHLPFIYNTCSTACYSYLPAFKQFGQNVKILHFIGQVKPWLLNFDSSSKTVYPPQGYGHLGEYLQQWWNVFCADVHPALTTEMGGLAGALAQLTLGSPRSAQQVAYEESMRRQCWEAGNIDYLGKDSFDNIWKRITKTIETKNDPPPTEKNRSPTPQPEEKLAVETKKRRLSTNNYDNTGRWNQKIQTKTFYDPVEIPGEEVEEETYEEIETFEPGSEKTTVTTTTETKDATESTVVPAEVGIVEEQPASDLLTQDETVKKDEKSQQEKTEESKALIDLKNQPIVIVPGHQKVEFDKETNTTTVTEKTTTGYQQTITTVTPDGRTIVQTKVFYDPIPSEQVEQAETTTTTTVTEVSDVPISKDNPETQQPTEVHEQCVETVKTTEAVKETEETTTTDGKDLQLALAAPAGQTSLTQKKTTAGGKEIEVTAVVSEDGKTKTLRKTTRQPSEEIEIEEYEETQSYEPGEVKVITTKKTVPLVEALEDAAKDIVDKSEKVVVTSTEKQVPEKSDSTIQTAVTEQVKSEEVQITTEAKPATTDPKQTTTTTESSTTVATQSTPIVKPTITADKQITAEEMETSTEAREVKTETKQTVIDANKIITEEKEAITESKQSTTEAKESISEAKQTVTDDTKITEAKQTTTEAKQTKTAAKEAITKAKETVTDAKKITEAKQSTTEAKQTTTEAKQAIIEAKQTVTDANKIKTEATETTTEAKETTTGAKQATSSVKKTITPASVPGKLGAVEPKQIKKVTKPEQTDSSVKKVSKPSDKDTKKTSPAVTVKTTTTTTTAVKKGEDTQKKTAADKTVTESTVIGEPKVTTKNGETTTEVVRRIPGGTEHTWTTVRADGSTKTESKKCFDVVELSSDEEYEEYEEIVEDDTIPLKTTTTKTQAPAAAASVKGPKTPTITDATPPSTPPLKPLVIGSTSSALKAEHEIPDTPPLDKVEQLRKKLQSAPASKVAPKVDKPVVEAPKGATTKVAQKVDKPVVEAPKAPVTKVAQKVDKPVVEAPKAPVTKVAQKADKPVVEAPKAPATKVAQKVDKPVVEAPKAPVTKVAQKVDKPVVEAPKAPPRKKEVKTPAAEK